jgi:hypothetical protein
MAHDLTPERQRTLQLQDRAFRFAGAVLRECPHDPISNIAARELWKQLVRAAPSASNNLIEARDKGQKALQSREAVSSQTKKFRN